MDFTFDKQRVCFTIPILEDDLSEPTETFAFELATDDYTEVGVTFRVGFEKATISIEDDGPLAGKLQV